MPNHPTYGWRTLKAAGKNAGTRLMPDGEDETFTIQARQSYSGPTVDYTFIRIWREDTGYQIIAMDEKGAIEAVAYGKKDQQVWDNILASLNQKGIG